MFNSKKAVVSQLISSPSLNEGVSNSERVLEDGKEPLSPSLMPPMTRMSSGSVVSRSDSMSAKNIDDMLAQELHGLGQTAVSDYNFEFQCENKKCRAAMSISGQAMRDAAREVMRGKGYKKGKKVYVEVACAHCGKTHQLQATEDMLG